MVVAFALSFVCSCRSILIISVLQCLLASAWIVPQVLLSIDIAVTLPSLHAGLFLLLSVVDCTSSVGGDQSGNRARRVQPGSTHRGHRGGLLTPTSLQQGQQESASDCCCTQHLWLFGWLVGCCLLTTRERQLSSYRIDCISRSSSTWCHLVLQVVDSLSWVERETKLSPCPLCVLAPSCYCLVLNALPVSKAINPEIEREGFNQVQRTGVIGVGC